VSTLTRAKIALALIGLVLFGAGVRLERTELRWTGLGFVVVAWLLRFASRRQPEETESPRE
jgi:hypothetical protein